MSNDYQVTVIFTPLCPSCGKECETSMTEVRPTREIFERDNPFERCHRRVFVTPCPDCWEWKPKSTPITADDRAQNAQSRG